MHLFRVITYVLFLALIISMHGCSTPDHGDMAQLEDTIDDLGVDERSIVDRLRISDKIRGWLKSRPQNDKFGTLKCVNGEKWRTGVTDPHDYLEMTVADVVAFLATHIDGFKSYEDMTEKFQDDFATRKGYQWDLCGMTKLDFRYDPDKGHVPDEVLHPDTSARGIVEWLIASPMPPPGLAWGGGLARLLPFLCALGAGWGCPADPSYPGPTTPGQTPAPSGDAP